MVFLLYERRVSSRISIYCFPIVKENRLKLKPFYGIGKEYSILLGIWNRHSSPFLRWLLSEAIVLACMSISLSMKIGSFMHLNRKIMYAKSWWKPSQVWKNCQPALRRAIHKLVIGKMKQLEQYAAGLPIKKQFEILLVWMLSDDVIALISFTKLGLSNLLVVSSH